MCKVCKPNPRKIDLCMMDICDFIKTTINLNTKGKLKIVASCCGHGKYPPSIIVKNHLGHIWELFNNVTIDRKKRFYKKDKQGYYYIPEIKETYRYIK